MKKQLLPLLLTAALGCCVFVGCGNDMAAERGAETTSTRRATTTVSTETTARTSDSTAPLEAHTSGSSASTDAHRTTETTKPAIIDKAESMIDDAEDVVTSVLTEATREIHNRD